MSHRISRAFVASLFVGAACSPMLAQEPTNTDDVRAVVAEMLSDAETRSSLLAGGDAGHDGKFFIAGDGFRLNIGGQIQFRYIADFRDDSNTDDFTHGFQSRRVRPYISGTVGKDWDFQVKGDFSRSDGTFSLLDSWAQYDLGSGWKVKFGQFKSPLLREELVDDAKQLAVERSMVNTAYTQDRSQGVQLSHQGESLRFAAEFDDGLNSKNTDFAGSAESTSTFKVSGQADWAATGRVEWLVSGDWKQFDDFTSPRGSTLATMIGLAGHYQQSQNTGNPADLDRDTLEYTADLSIEGDGWNIYGQFVGRYTKLRMTGGENTFNDFGALVHAGYYVTDKAEIFARWEALFLDGDRFSGDGPTAFHFLDAGFNYYFAGHAAKFTADFVWSFNKTDRLNTLGILKDTGVGLLGDTHENEVVARGQFQLLF